MLGCGWSKVFISGMDSQVGALKRGVTAKRAMESAIMCSQAGRSYADVEVSRGDGSSEWPLSKPLKQPILDEIGHCRNRKSILNAMTIDVEDYFHVLAFDDVIHRDRWDSLPRRVEQNTNRLLEIFADAGTKATFFTLGWVAERHPGLISRIANEGHELASHGYAHIRADRQNYDQFREDVRKAKLLLEDIAGTLNNAAPLDRQTSPSRRKMRVEASVPPENGQRL
jgi:hypothetical protein